MTEATTQVDAPRAVMWSIKQVAERDRVSKQAVSKRVKRLVEQHGLSVERNSQGAITALNVAEYDHLNGRYSDPSKTQAPRSELPDAIKPSESYDEALRQKTWHEAERRRIELDELKRKLVRVDDVLPALARCAEAIVMTIDRLPNSADDLAGAVAREGTHGLRVELKKIAVGLRKQIDKALTAVAQAMPEERDVAEDVPEP